MHTLARPQTHRPLLGLHEARQQGLGVLIIVGIVLALFVCRALVLVIAHVPNEETQYMNTTAHALRTIHGQDGPCPLPSVAMLGASLHGVPVPPLLKSHGHLVIACEDGAVQPGGQIIYTLLDRLLGLRVDFLGPSLKLVLSIARLPPLAVSAARASI